MTNEQLIIRLLLEYALRTQAAARLLNLAASENRDVTDEEVDASSLSRDAAIVRAEQAINGA